MTFCPPPDFQLLPWNSEFFGFTVARTNDTRLSPASLFWKKANGVPCLYLAAGAYEATSLALAAPRGF